MSESAAVAKARNAGDARSSRRRRRAPVLLVFAAIVAFGVWLRIDQIADQILADDEWHTLNYLREQGYRAILEHFGVADHCIPMTLLNKLVADSVGLTELTMRALPLACGLAALVVLPMMLLPRFGAKRVVLFGTLLAISPAHVYFSRYARPYAVIFLLGLAGVLAFERHLASGSKRCALVYAACAILVPWFHPLFLPFMLAPLGFALVRELPDRARLVARLRSTWPIAVVVGVCLAGLLVPPVLFDFKTIRERSGLGELYAVTFRVGFDLVSGTDRTLTRLVFAGACAVGMLSWFLRRRAWLAYCAFLCACQTLGIVCSMPANVGVPITAVRYLLPLLGFALLAAAEGLVRVDAMLHRESRGWIPHHLPSSAACAAFLAWSPLLAPFEPENAVYFHPNAWTNHALYQFQYARSDREFYERDVLLPKRTSSFYTKLAQFHPDGAGSRRIVEAPWCYDWSCIAFPITQRIHGWPMVIGFVHEPGEKPPDAELPWPDARFRFRNFVDLADFDGLRERGVAFVVLHKHRTAELPRATREDEPSLERVFARYAARFGAPCFEDDDLVVFDVRSHA
jgi:hypothetical protein